MAEELICYCKRVDKDKILQTIAQGYYSVEAIGEITQAGTGCGSCQLEIQRLIDFLKQTRSDLPPTAPLLSDRWKNRQYRDSDSGSS